MKEKMKVKTRTIKMLIIFILFSVVYIYNYNNLIGDFESTAAARQSDIDKDIQTSVNFIDALTIFGNNYFEDRSGLDPDKSDLYQFLEYKPDGKSYSLDSARAAVSEKTIGNITGLGKIPEGGPELQNICLALDYYDFCYKFYDRFPDIAWIYYTGENSFISMYPWVSSEEFSYSEALKKVPFYTVAIPENNGNRDAVWTPVYLDQAGKGLMVTLSSPIYDGDTFMGVVSADLTNRKLTALLECPYESYLVDNTDSVIATTKKVDFNGKVYTFKELIKNVEFDTAGIITANGHRVEIIGNYYIYTSAFANAPWKMIMLESIYAMLLKALVRTLPVIFICILLLFTMHEVEKRREAEMILTERANTDQLTCAKSRRYLEQKISEEICRADRYKKPLSMIIFDLDHFKSVNDKWGHPVGDDVLVQVAELTKDAVREIDTLARLGGEEFAVLMPETELQGAKISAERIRDMLNKNFHPVAGIVTASFGVAERADNETFESWYKRADEAVYRAKEKGRNCVVCAD